MLNDDQLFNDKSYLNNFFLFFNKILNDNFTRF